MYHQLGHLRIYEACQRKLRPASAVERTVSELWIDQLTSSLLIPAMASFTHQLTDGFRLHRHRPTAHTIMGLFSCFSPAELPPEQRDLIEMQKELQKVKHQLQEAQSDAASARKTLTIAIQRIGSTPSQPSSPSADAKDSPRIAASTAQSAPGTPTHADPQPKAVSNSGSTGSADAPAAGAGRSSADAQDLHAQVLFLERQLHGSGANTLSGLQQSNQRLVQQMDALNVRLLEARQVGGMVPAARLDA
jgi:hypothetical protein